MFCAAQVKVENTNVMVYMAEQKFNSERLRKQLGKPVRVSASVVLFVPKCSLCTVRCSLQQGKPLDLSG